MNQYPFALERAINRRMKVTVRGDGFFFWKEGNEWFAQHPDMSPEHYFVGDVVQKANEWMAFRRAQKEAKS